MTIDELRSKAEAAQQRVEKCKGTIQRHIAQMKKKGQQLRDMGIDPETADKYEFVRNGQPQNNEAYWLLCDYESKKEDIVGATKKLSEAERICNTWTLKLDLEINREKVIQDQAPEVIKQFLEDWKQKTYQWYILRHAYFVETKAELREQVREAKIEAVRTLPEYAEEKQRLEQRYGSLEAVDNYHFANLWPRKPVEQFLRDKELDDKSVKAELSRIGDGTIAKMCEFRKEEDRLQWLDKTLDQEKRAHLLWFVENVTQITGPITDAKGLCMSGGDLNGVVLGEKGAAKVNTFSAGGWNIQRFHFRTRIDDVTEMFKSQFTKVKPSLDSQIHSASSKQAEASVTDARSAEQQR